MSDGSAYVCLPTVRELLDLPELQAGEPEVRATERALEAGVRWAHVVAGVTSAALLDGGELLLTTGAGWPDPRDEHTSSRAGAELTALLHELCDAGISALVFELGTRFTEVPREVVAVLAERDVALIVLHREVRFVHITQRVHRLILGAHNEALEAKSQVHTLFTELGLNRSPVDYMVEQMAAVMGAPIVLENTTGQVIAWSSPDTSVGAAEVLADWASGHFEPSANEGIVRVPVEAQGTRWGTLTALPGPHHPAGRTTVLELGAIALALGRLADDGDTWLDLASKQLFDTLLGGRFRTDTDLEMQLAAAGLPFEGRTLGAVSLTSVGEFGGHPTLEHAVLETALRRALAPEGRAIIADASTPGMTLLALVSLPATDARARWEGNGDPLLASRLSRELEMLVPATTPPVWRAHLSLGVTTGDERQSASVRGLITSLEGVLTAGLVEPSATVGRVTVQEASRQPLTYLLREFAGSPALGRFIGEVLGPLIEHDRGTGPGHTGDLMRVLEAVLRHPTNRSLAASEARLSRSVLYQRIELIEDLLGADLTDGETLTTLSVALTAHAIHS